MKGYWFFVLFEFICLSAAAYAACKLFGLEFFSLIVGAIILPMIFLLCVIIAVGVRTSFDVLG